MPKPLIITNFAGRLTRQNFGDINSGFAKYDTSWGYNPFFSPGSLSWFKSPSDVSSIIADGSLILDAQSRWESGTLFTYAISDSAKLWKITGEGSGASLFATLSAGTPTFSYGGTLKFFGGKIYIGHDKGVTRINFDGTGELQVFLNSWASDYIQNTYRPMQEFTGSLYVGNTTDGTNVNIGQIDSTLNLTIVSKLNPALGTVNYNYVRDLDITPDFTYIIISLSNIAPENIAPVNDTTNTASGTSEKFYWNGQDLGVTNGVSLPGFGITALNTFGPFEYSMMYDTFGAALYSQGKKKWTLRNSKSPFPNGTVSTGNFLSWVTPELYWNEDSQAGSLVGGLFYYGSLDDEVGEGLWRLQRWTSFNGGVIYQAPFNHFTTNRYVSINTSATIQVDSNGTHLISYTDTTGSGGTTTKFLKVFYAAPPDDSPGSWTGACPGVYETQTQLFSQKQVLKQVRVYMSPTVSNNGFNIDLIGSNNTIIPVSNPMTYTYAGGTDETQLQGSLTRIDFNPNMAPDYGIGIRITNTGGINMSINKIECDPAPAGK